MDTDAALMGCISNAHADSGGGVTIAPTISARVPAATIEGPFISGDEGFARIIAVLTGTERASGALSMSLRT